MTVEETGAKISREESADTCINVTHVRPLLCFMTTKECLAVVFVKCVLKPTNEQ